MPLERRLDGIIEAVNQGTVAAQTSGRVASIEVDVNDFVPAGAVLVRLRSTEQRASLAEAQATLAGASAQATQAQAHYRRIADLYAQRVLPKAQLDQATAARDAAVAAVAAARAALDAAREGVAYTEVRAPYAWVVSKRLVQLGESVHPGTPLISGLSLGELRVAVDIPQSILDQVRRLRQAAVYIGDRRIEATHVTVFPEATVPSSTFHVRLDLPANSADLYPGMFVKSAFVVGEVTRLLIPAHALVQRSEVSAVYVIDDSGVISMRQVRVGDVYGVDVALLSGLKSGERVALDPLAAAARLEQQAEAADPSS
jgi:RND family efflux transporter MFP subunit